MERHKFLFPVARMSPLALKVMDDYSITADEAVSMVVSHGKSCGMVFSVEGWPFNCVIFALKATSLRSVADFVYEFGFRLVWSAECKDGVGLRRIV